MASTSGSNNDLDIHSCSCFFINYSGGVCPEMAAHIALITRKGTMGMDSPDPLDWPLLACMNACYLLGKGPPGYKPRGVEVGKALGHEVSADGPPGEQLSTSEVEVLLHVGG